MADFCASLRLFAECQEKAGNPATGWLWRQSSAKGSLRSNSLIRWKIQGNFPDLAAKAGRPVGLPTMSQLVTPKFPTHPNRDFCRANRDCFPHSRENHLPNLQRMEFSEGLVAQLDRRLLWFHCSMNDTTTPPSTHRSPDSRRVFFLGATGTIGRATVRALVRRGHQVVCFVRPRAGARGALTPAESVELLKGAAVRFGDFTDPDWLELCRGSARTVAAGPAALHISRGMMRRPGPKQPRSALSIGNISWSNSKEEKPCSKYL